MSNNIIIHVQQTAIITNNLNGETDWNSERMASWFCQLTFSKVKMEIFFCKEIEITQKVGPQIIWSWIREI